MDHRRARLIAEHGLYLGGLQPADAIRIAGLKTAEIEAVLGYEARSAMVHRDDLVVSRAQEAVGEEAKG